MGRRSGCVTCERLAPCSLGSTKVEGFQARELGEDERLPVLRSYLKRWKFEVGVFFEGVGPDSTDEELRSIASRHPAFEVLPPTQQ